MNSDVIRRVLDLDTIPAGAEGLRFVFERPLEPWVWALLLAACLALAAWSYSRLSGRFSGRAGLTVVRAMILAMVIAIICGPAIELPRERIEQDWVLILADRSESMTIPDVEGAGGRQSRDEQLREVFEAHHDVLRDLAAKRHVVWLGFHGGAFDLSTVAQDGEPGDLDESSREPLAIDLGEPTGPRTSLDAAIQQGLQRAAARPLSGVVVLSDGRTDDPPGRSLIRRLQADAVPVFVVPLGSTEPLGDLAIRRLDAPRRAFVRDEVPVTVEINRLGAAVRDVGATVRLIDTGSGEELDSTVVAPGDERDRITLTAKPDLAGEATWRIVVETDQPDLIAENNAREFAIELIDRPLRVLYVEGYPRWEYRYVKNLLVREKSISSSVMLLSADRDFAQEGNQPITRLPRSAEELAEFDVIILGDVPGTFFSPQQLDLIRAHVAERGAGLLWIAGERSVPTTYSGTSLADLLPFRGSLALPPIGVPVNMRPTEIADRLGVLRLQGGGELPANGGSSPGGGDLVRDDEPSGWPRELSDPAAGWSQLYFAQRIEPGRLKPTAEVLAETVQVLGGAPLPLVVHMRYGAGQALYVASDEIWRWRYGRGEALPEQFWVQMIRMLGRDSLSGGDAPAVLEADPRRLIVGQPLRIVLRIRDAALAQERREGVAAVIETASGERVAEIELRRAEGSEDEFTATYLPDVTGPLRVRIDDPALRSPGLEDEVEVFRPDDELRAPETDHALLANLAKETGGDVIEPDQLASLAERLPNRSVRTLNPLIEPIWDTPLVLALVLLVLSVEWIGRKLLRLV